MTRAACLILVILCFLSEAQAASGGSHGSEVNFPPTLESYNDSHLTGIGDVLAHRAGVEPFNIAATVIFVCAILHTFLTSRLMGISHRWEHEHADRVAAGERPKGSVHFGAGIFHFLGEVEAVFGIWAIALVGTIIGFFDWHTAIGYLTTKVNYTEPMFVGVIMILAATRPMLKAAELLMWKVANLFGGMLAAWWLTILTVGPILGSFITEPAAMTISALLLGEKFYALAPSNRFKYATLGLLFVNISVGGTLTHFAAPPVLMVAGPWGWDLMHMLTSFGWKAVIGIVLANGIYYFRFRGEMAQLQEKYAVVRMKRELQSRFVNRADLEREFEALEESVGEELGFSASFDAKCAEIKAQLHAQILEKVDGLTEQRGQIDRTLLDEAFEQRFEEIRIATMRKSLPGLLSQGQRPPYRDPNWDQREDFVPGWMILIHILFMAWTVFNAHYPALFIGGFLFYLGFAQATAPYQNRLDLKPPLLVGFFLAGLVMHGGVQGWWIAPVLGSLGELPLLVGATVLTAFNDNAAITYLSTLVPGFTDTLKYAVVAGAVTGGGLTVIANAPNPAGQSILKRYFEHGISPAGLLGGAVVPTLVMGLCFALLRF